MSLQLESTTSPQSADLVRSFLNTHASGVLATADKAGQPHAAVVYFSPEDDFSLLFGTKTETQKYKNMQENNQVSFVLYDEKEQTTVQITGRVEEIEDVDKRDQIVTTMFALSAEQSKREIPPAEKLIAGDYAALRLIPLVIKMAVYARPDSQGDDLYETLLFGEV